ncbi:MAG: hypothetical protein ACKO5K_06495, partial [Armatimonadota bacterium]
MSKERFMVVSMLIAAALLSAGCGNSASRTAAPEPASTVPAAAPPQRSGAFDGARAYADLKRQVGFGPRIPGTKGHAACRDWIVAEMGKSCPGAVVRQDVAVTVRGVRLPMTNIGARINPEAKTQ